MSKFKYPTTKFQTKEVSLYLKGYNMNQLILPLDLEVKLHKNDIAFSNHHLVESIPLIIKRRL